MKTYLKLTIGSSNVEKDYKYKMAGFKCKLNYYESNVKDQKPLKGHSQRMLLDFLYSCIE
jgi:hypothetical protein